MPLALTATGMADYIQSISPEVEATVRINKAYGSRVIQHGDHSFIEAENMLFADSSFFEVFDFEAIEGNVDMALDEPFEVILTEKAAWKYFGQLGVVGEMLEFDEQPMKVSAVLKDVPSNSHLQFDFLISMATFLESRPTAHENWNWVPMNTFLLLRKDADLTKLTEQLNHVPAYDDSHAVEEYVIALEAFNQVHFSEVYRGQLGTPGNRNHIYILFGIGVVILLLACFNYINLTTATMSLYEKEVSFRKTIGATGKNIFSQFMVESVLIVGLSWLFSLLLSTTLLRKFEVFLGVQYGWKYFLQPTVIAILIAIPLTLALLGGLYPARKFAGIAINKVIRRAGPRRLADTRSFLLAFQFCMDQCLDHWIGHHHYTAGLYPQSGPGICHVPASCH